MDNDMRKALLNKKSGAFDKSYEECLQKFQRIKHKNDFMQKQVGTSLEDTLKKELSKQKQFIEVILLIYSEINQVTENSYGRYG